MMKSAIRMILFLLMSLSMALFAAAAKPEGKGGGGGNKPFFDEVPAEFQFYAVCNPAVDCPLTVLTGDGSLTSSTDPAFSIYKDDPGGIQAHFMRSGNPRLELGDPLRHLYLRLDSGEPGCGIARASSQSEFYAKGDALWFLNLSTTEWGEPGYQTIDGRFWGMGVGSSAYSLLILRFPLDDEVTGKEYLWALIFGDNNDNNPDATRVIVTRTSETSWKITGQDGALRSIAHVKRTNTKGKAVTEDLGYCSASIKFDILALQ